MGEQPQIGRGESECRVLRDSPRQPVGRALEASNRGGNSTRAVCAEAGGWPQRRPGAVRLSSQIYPFTALRPTRQLGCERASIAWMRVGAFVDWESGPLSGVLGRRRSPR